MQYRRDLRDEQIAMKIALAKGHQSDAPTPWFGSAPVLFRSFDSDTADHG